MASFGITWVAPEWDIVLPVGISFYTFVTLSYTLDVYLGRLKPIDSFLNYALFVTYFPHLVAGPIVRPTQLVPQFETPKQATRDQMLWGLGLMVLGLFEKVVVADAGLANVADRVFSAEGPIGFADAWLGTLAFSGQIFCDFAGYSTIAVGVSLCLGFALPDNFRMPYAAIGFSDFWRRWHISLSTWLRDYLYIPLGGNRGSEVRTYVNLMLTMLLGGLWHGANWTFVVWGGLHGLYLAAERWIRAKTGVAGDPVGTLESPRARTPHVFPGQHHLGVLPRGDIRGRGAHAGRHVRLRRRGAGRAADDLHDQDRRDRRRHRHRAMADAEARAGGRRLTHAVVGDGTCLRRDAVCGDHRAGFGRSVHLLPVLGDADEARTRAG